MSPKKEKKIAIVIDPIGGLQPGDEGYPEPPFQDDGDYEDWEVTRKYREEVRTQ